MDQLQKTLTFGGGGVIIHRDKRTHKQCRFFFYFRKRKISEKKVFFQFSESLDSRCKMSSNGRRRRVRLAKKWSWVRSDGPKVPRMQRNEETIFY